MSEVQSDPPLDFVYHVDVRGCTPHDHPDVSLEPEANIGPPFTLFGGDIPGVVRVAIGRQAQLPGVTAVWRTLAKSTALGDCAEREISGLQTAKPCVGFESRPADQNSPFQFNHLRDSDLPCTSGVPLISASTTALPGGSGGGPAQQKGRPQKGEFCLLPVGIHAEIRSRATGVSGVRGAVLGCPLCMGLGREIIVRK